MKTNNSSFLSEAAGDEKKAEWLKYNLKLIPETVEKTKAQVAARGAKILSYNITINGYDSMTAELCTQVEADPGTEIVRKELEERLEKRKEEKKAEKKADEEKAAEKRAEKRAAEEVRTESGEYTISATGTDVKAVTQSVVSAALGTPAPMGVSFDVKT